MGTLCVIGLCGQTAFLNAESLPHPGETVKCTSLFYEPGGKGLNQAIAASRMGSRTRFIGAVGTDVYASGCYNALKAEGIEAFLVEKSTPTAFAVVSTDLRGENMVQVFSGAAGCLTSEDIRSERIVRSIQSSDCILLQNELNIACTAAVLELAGEQRIPVIFNPAPASTDIVPLLHSCDLITPNLEEAKVILGIPQGDLPSDETFAEKLMELGIPQAILTDGSRGSILRRMGKASRIAPFHAGITVDTTGAGDVFSGTLATFLTEGCDLCSAAEAASAAAGISVTRHGAAFSAPKRDDLPRKYG